MYINGHNDLDSHSSRYFTDFPSKSGYYHKKFRRISVGVLPVVEEVEQKTSLYTISISKKENM